MLSQLVANEKMSYVEAMTIAVGFAVTQEPILSLLHRGFALEQYQVPINHGYHRFVCPIGPSNTGLIGFEIREVLDEVAYLKAQPEHKLAPFLHIDSAAYPSATNPNSVTKIESQLGPEDFSEHEISLFFRIRKTHIPWALWLRCQDLKIFEAAAKPDRIFKWKNRQAAVIHLGPNCFDLVVTE